VEVTVGTTAVHDGPHRNITMFWSCTEGSKTMQQRENTGLQSVPVADTRAIRMALVLTALFILALCICEAPVYAVSAEVPEVAGQEQAAPGDPWGIRVIGIRRTAADYMLDFRFRMLDPEKAATIMNRKIKPQLIVEKNGHRLQVPVSAKIGPLRQAPKFAKVNRNYFMFFANPGRAVKAGDQVTLVIGDFRQEHIVVE
jgi:hypothetical protein